MRSFSDIPGQFAPVPLDLVQLVGSIEYSRGREQLYEAQAPQILKRLAARTRFDSITASSAIENVILDDQRALEVLRGSAPGPYRDRSEEEFAGYRDAVDYLIGKDPEKLTVPLMLHLHRLLMRNTGDPSAGKLKTSDNFIGTDEPGGRSKVIFKTVPAGKPTEQNLTELVERYESALESGQVSPLLLISALILDFLAIHPFEEGNGRIARLLTTNELLRNGYGVAKYVSLEQRIFDTKNSYYLALRESQSGWHKGTHDYLYWARYLLRIIEDAYADFEKLMASDTKLVGTTKREQAKNYVLTHAPRRFQLAQIDDALPDISQATIRDALDGLRDEGHLTAERGRGARWERVPEAEPGA
ncbi:MAG: Fic family protein [Thermoleophilia bacterium]|nr:Fic family protein [Thermoleophilia bacterium]